MRHELKCWPEYFAPLMDGSKKFEIRRNDRPYAVGDELRLREWSPVTKLYTGHECARTVTYMTTFAQEPGYVVMGLADNVTPDVLRAAHEKIAGVFHEYTEMDGAEWQDIMTGLGLLLEVPADQAFKDEWDADTMLVLAWKVRP